MMDIVSTLRTLEPLVENQFASLLSTASETQSGLKRFAVAASKQPERALHLLTEQAANLLAAGGRTTTREILQAILVEVISGGGAGLGEPVDTLLQQYKAAIDADWCMNILGKVHKEHRRELYSEVISVLLRRYPHHAGIQRSAADFALERGEAELALQRYQRLATLDESAATKAHIYRVQRSLPASGQPSVKVALLSSFTVDLLLPSLNHELRKLGLAPEMYVGPFNAWAQELLGEQSEFKRFGPDIAFLSVGLDDLIPELATSSPVSLLEPLGDAALGRLVSAVSAYVSAGGCPLVVHSFYSVYPDPLGVARHADPGQSRSAWVHRLNLRLAQELSAFPGVYVLDMPGLLMHRRDGAFDNPKMRHLASMRLTDQMLAELAACYARYVAPIRGMTKKCVVLDLDNTLWGGIVGEDGIHGIKLGKTAPGSEFREFQLYLKGLLSRGFLLAINSKNNPDDALAVIRRHEDMALHEEDFSAVRINWTAKHENMLSIADELNIGVDSLVFIDDNPKERELMRQLLPQVLVPEMPADPALYRRTLECLPQLQTLEVTDEDRTRVEQYRAIRQRDVVKKSTGSLDEYLKSLELVVVIGHADEATVPRVHQLLQRTNQFNMTTRRYDLAEVGQFAADPSRTRLYAMWVRDRFGDHGLVGVALVRARAEDWLIDSFLMSCRVIGYGAETCLLARILSDAGNSGIQHVVGEFIETKKNVPARDFYSRHGFENAGSVGDVQLWRVDIKANSVAVPQWVRMESYGA